MRTKIIAAAGLTLLLTAGCADGDSGSDDAGGEPTPAGTVLPQKLTQPDTKSTPKAQPSPAEDAPFAEQLAYELRSRTLDMAQAEGKTTATCPSDLASKKATTTTCTTTFDGLTVKWKVTIGDHAAWSDNYVQYKATPSTGILTRDGVAKLLYGNYRDSIDYALCNDIPEAALAPLNAKSKYRCEVVFKGKKPLGYADPVQATEAGPRAY